MEVKEIHLGSSLDEKYINFINKFRGHPTNLKSYNWQFSYIPKKTVITGIVNNKNVLGTQCMMPIEIIYRNTPILSGKCENSYLDESLRGKNYFTELFSFATNLCDEKEIELLWAFTPAIKPYSRLGFQIYENCLISSLLYIKPPPIKRFFYNRKGFSRIKGVVAYCIAIFSSYYISLALYKNNFKKVNIVVLDNLVNNSDIESLNKKLNERHPSLIQINHSKQFLDWRVFQNPNIRIASKFFYLNDMLIGYCLYTKKDDSVLVRSLIYYNPKHLNPILIELVKFFRKKNVFSITYQGNYENILNREIFLIIRKYSLRKINKTGLSFVYKFSNKNNSTLKDKENWKIDNLWTEGY